MKKTILLIQCFLLLLLLLPFQVFAEDIKQDADVKIGYHPDYATINNLDFIGYEGYGYELFEEISKYTGRKYTFVPGTSQELVQMQKDGEIELMGPYEITAERERQFAFTSNSVGSENIILCAPLDADIAFDEIEKIHGKRVATIHDFYTGELDAFLEANNLEVTYVDCNEMEFMEGLARGEFDFILGSTMLKMPNMKIILDLGCYPLYFVANKENQCLIDEIDVALNQIYQKDLMFTSKLHQKYFNGDEYPRKRLSREQERLFEKKNVFTVGFSPESDPVQYLDKDGNPAGISIDIMNMIAEEANIEVQYVPLEPITTGYHQTVDINLCYLSEYIDKDHFYATNPYWELSLSYIGKSDNHKAGTIRLAMPNFAFIDRSSFLNQDELEIVDNLYSIRERFWALNKGTVDYIMASDVVADIIMQKLGYSNYKMYPIGQNMPLHLMVSKDLPPQYVEAFDVLISLLNKDAINVAIIENAVITRENQSFLELFHKYRAYISMVLITICLIVIALILNKQKALKKAIETDRLSGFYTEQKFLEEGKKLLAKAEPGEYMLVSIDVDNFQYINEVYGYRNGTLVLKEFSEQLKHCYQNSELIARVNADRFLTLTKVVKSNSFCGREVCKGCLSHVTSKILPDNYSLSISRGVYVIANPQLDLNYMVDCVESARKISKVSYGQREQSITLFTEEMEQHRNHVKKIVSSMENALEQKEFTVMYQPKIDLRTRQMSGAEALVRWIRSDGTMVYPDDFIPIFEGNGFIEEVDYYVFEEVCAFISANRWQETIPPIAVNISGVTLLKDDFTQTIFSLLAKYELQPTDIEIEITESVIIGNYKAASAKILVLRDAGFRVAMDDFGSGFSSMSRLMDIPVDILKIDKGILFQFDPKNKNIIILKSALLMGKGLELTTVAEGVETKAQADWLTKEGCDIAQGYYFAKPMFEKEFLSYMKTAERRSIHDNTTEPA